MQKAVIFSEEEYKQIVDTVKELHDAVWELELAIDALRKGE